MRRPIALCILLPVCGGAVSTTAAAQADEILLVERGADRAGRDRVVRLLRKKKMDLIAEKLDADDLAKLLGIAADSKVNFVPFSKEPLEEGWPALEADIRNRPVLSIMGVVTQLSDLRFVYRSGVVLMKPVGQVSEQKVLRMYDIRAAVAPIRDRPGPKLGLTPPGEESFDDVSDDEGKTFSGMDISRVEDLIRNNVAPDSWDTDGTSLSHFNGTLMVRQTERIQKKVAELLIMLGMLSPPLPVPVPVPVPDPAPKPAPASTKTKKPK